MTKERTKEVLAMYYQECDKHECSTCPLNDYENECSIKFFYDQGKLDAIDEVAIKLLEIIEPYRAHPRGMTKTPLEIKILKSAEQLKEQI